MAEYISFQPNENNGANIWSGNGTSPRAMTGLGFQPDFTWVKSRDGNWTHTLFDVVRGVGSNKELCISTTAIEGGTNSAASGYVSAFGADGYTLTAGSSNDNFNNDASYTYAGWSWKGGGAGVSNTNGDITSTVSANTAAGFSIVKFTGNATAGQTVGHGLTKAPDFIITKNIAGTNGWYAYLSALGNAYVGYPNTSDQWDSGSTLWNSTSPTTTVFTVGNNSGVNPSSADQIAYCWHSVKGCSKFGTYRGNNSTDGTFVYTGFRPSLIWIKNKGADSWFIYDVKRMPVNYQRKTLKCNVDDVEQSGTTNENLDILSNGFKLRYSTGGTNDDTDYTYMAWAEFPIVSSNDMPGVAR